MWRLRIAARPCPRKGAEILDLGGGDMDGAGIVAIGIPALEATEVVDSLWHRLHRC
jgi:hypothetical protein